MHGPLNLRSYSTPITRILGVDLGKFNSVLCVYDPATHDHRFVLGASGTAQAEPVCLLAHVETECAVEPGGHVQVRYFESEPGEAGDFWRVHHDLV